MLSREFRKVYHPSLGRFVYEHRGNGLIVDNIMKPLKAAVSTAANKAGRAVAKAIGKKTSKAAEKAKAKAAERGGFASALKKAVAEKSGDIIRKRLNRFSLGQAEAKPPLSRRKISKEDAKMRRHHDASAQKKTRNEVNTLINNLIARS